MKQLIGEIITSFFEICRTKEFEREISLYQGHRDAYPQGIVDWLKETENCEKIISAITELTENKVFRDFVLDQVRKEKNEELSELIRKQLTADSERVYSICDIQINEIKKYLEVLDWDWYVENNYKSLSDFMPLVEDWKWILLSQLYGYYKKLEYGRFLPYDKGYPL